MWVNVLKCVNDVRGFAVLALVFAVVVVVVVVVVVATAASFLTFFSDV
jgi:hypothetical protein